MHKSNDSVTLTTASDFLVLIWFDMASGLWVKDIWRASGISTPATTTGISSDLSRGKRATKFRNLSWCVNVDPFLVTTGMGCFDYVRSSLGRSHFAQHDSR